MVIFYMCLAKRAMPIVLIGLLRIVYCLGRTGASGEGISEGIIG